VLLVPLPREALAALRMIARRTGAATPADVASAIVCEHAARACATTLELAAQRARDRQAIDRQADWDEAPSWQGTA
jgi:hypothetical protein